MTAGQAFAHSLALRLGVMVTDLARMPVSEFLDWQHYFKELEQDNGAPAGEDMTGDQLAAMLGARP